MQRITIEEIKKHPWFLKNLPRELTESAQAMYYERNAATFAGLQSVEEIMEIVADARNPPTMARTVSGFPWGEEAIETSKDDDDDDRIAQPN